MASSSDPAAAAKFAHQALALEIERVNALHRDRLADPPLARALERLAQWQAARLRATYADLEAQPRYTDAVVFFETDLYGGTDFAQRDADVAKVAPIMTMMLPDRVIATIAQAMELNALSQKLDRALLARLAHTDGRFSVGDYCAAYRSLANRPERERQIAIIAEIGAALDRFVRTPFIHAALTMMRQPARLAGMGVLHEFLERGFNAFRRMKGADFFLRTIVERETALMEAIFAGASTPFPAPQVARRSQSS